jgi:hypothetical protein
MNEPTRNTEPAPSTEAIAAETALSAPESTPHEPPSAAAPAPEPTPYYPPPPPVPPNDGIDLRGAFRQQSDHWLLGPALWTVGALSWAYVVVGEFVVNLGLPEFLGFVLVLVSMFATWAHAVRLSEGAWFSVRKLGPLFLSLILFLGFLFVVVSVLGSRSRGQTSAVTVMFWFVSVFAFLLGRRWTALPRYGQTKHARIRTIATWMLSGFASCVAMISAMDRM